MARVVQETENSIPSKCSNIRLARVDFPEPLGPETIRSIPYLTGVFISYKFPN